MDHRGAISNLLSLGKKLLDAFDASAQVPSPSSSSPPAVDHNKTKDLSNFKSMGLSGTISNLLCLGAKLLPAVAATAQALSSSSSPPVDQNHQIQAELEKMMRMLERIQATLYDAEQREITDLSVKLWLKELKGVAYRAEDVLGEYNYEVLRAQVNARDACPPDSRERKLIQVPSGMLDQIQQIRSSFDEISKDQIALQLSEGDGPRRCNNKLQIAQTSHLVDESDIFGRESEKEKLIDLLSSECDGVSVVAIVGMGGIGKTTVAQLACNDQRIRQRFDKFGWICVSGDFNVERLTKESLESITGSRCSLTNLSALQEKIRKEMSGKRVLLVLDDVWNVNKDLWALFRVPFKSAAVGKILVTTRNNPVAQIMQAEPTFNLGSLSAEQCWRLFEHYAFGGVEQKKSPKLVEIGKQIMNKCGLLPLAVKSIAILLRHEDEEENWRDILENELCQSDVEREIISYLQISNARLVGDSPVYGRENEKNSIIEYLLSDDFNRNNPTVVCIVGENGNGKTSIVHLIYSEERVLDSFDASIFITMPEKCDDTRLLNKLIESITGFPCPMTEADLLEDLLIDELSGTKVFVVLDDADNENPCFWNRIVTLLNHSSRGSVLLVTTKSKDVAEVMGAMQTYYLHPLSDYYCWKIFWQHISTGLSTNANSDLVAMSMRLVSMCQHNPLGIKVLAGLLVCSKNEESLVKILKTDLSEIFGFNGDTLPILRVGYELLPDNLKKCLHYCSLFPKDYVFAKQQSVRMWMSQGFIIPVEGRQPEEVGLQNFDELLLRGFFWHSPVHDVEEDKFIMHDIIHALATNLSRRKYPPADDALERIFDNCFHFSLNPSKIQIDKMKPLNNSDLQSFLALTRFSLPERINFSILDLTSLTDLFTKCINLRTLDLSCADIVELPSSVGMLKHLRYFGVNNTKIRSIPRELCSLGGLQTLEAKDCQHLVELPESMMELKNLRHLDVSKKSGCVKMMNGIGQLTNLQSLASFCVGSEIPYCSIRELKDLNCLSSCLQIAGLENIRNGLDAKEAVLHNKVHLNTLWLHWNDNRTCTESEESVTISEEVLNNLKPNPQIAELIIRNYGGNLFPTWMGDPSMLKLVSIILDKCLNCIQFPALGGLPSLRHLSVQKLYLLVRLENTDNQFGSKNTPKFPSLETLNLWEMYNLEELFETSDRDFPCLRTLSINRCPMLKKIPCFFSILNLRLSCCVKLPYLPNFPSLESLTIDGFQKMKSLELPKDLPALKKLEIRHCQELLLVEGLPKLLSLEKLNIVHCPNFDSFKSWKPRHPKSISTTRWFFPKEESTTHVEHEETSNLAESTHVEHEETSNIAEKTHVEEESTTHVEHEETSNLAESKIVIEVQMHCDKCRTKAMKIAASTYGVESVALQGDDRNRLVVTGAGVDSVNLTKTLRKKIGQAFIVEQGEDKKKEDKQKVEEYKILWQPQPAVLVYDPLESNPNPCSII